MIFNQLCLIIMRVVYANEQHLTSHHIACTQSSLLICQQIKSTLYIKIAQVKISKLQHLEKKGYTDTSVMNRCSSPHVRSDPGLPEGCSSGTFLLTELEKPGGAGRTRSSGANEDSLCHYVRSSWRRDSP